MFRGGKLEKAKISLKRRQFSRVIAILEPLVIEYRDSFDFFYMLGVACLYLGDLGGANSYFQRARQIKIRDINLMLAQAVLYLRRGNISVAVEYYLDVQELDPSNAIAKNALQFIRKNGDESNISQLISSGRITRFYPPLGLPIFARHIVGLAAIFVLLVGAAVFLPRYYEQTKIAREDLRFLELTAEEKKNSAETDLSGSIRYILTKKQITDSYNAAQKFFQDFRDNMAQIEINRILLSNAADGIKEKSITLAGYLKTPTFDTLKDSLSFSQISSDPYLYENCYVVWSGRVSNVRENESLYECDFLVGYDTLKNIDGIMPLVLEQPVSIDAEKPLKILAQLDLVNSVPVLKGRAVFQSVRE